jgi:hypothetical protein
VISGFFDGLNGFSICKAKIVNPFAQEEEQVFFKVFQSRQGKLAQGDEIFNFDLKTIFKEGIF